MLVYPVGTTDACQYAARELKKSGIDLVDHPTPEVTHLVLDVPSFGPDGKLRDGSDLHHHLERLPSQITVVGGNLRNPALIEHRCMDLLMDANYLAINAAITADCAIRVASREMKTVFYQCPVLVLGWGRIGKCLAQLLKALGAKVTVAARKEPDRAMIRALGYRTVSIFRLPACLQNYRVIFNTIPEMVLGNDLVEICQDCVKIDLASQRGIAGEDVVWARGLPGIYAPESSGKLIAGTFLKLAGREKL